MQDYLFKENKSNLTITYGIFEQIVLLLKDIINIDTKDGVILKL